MSNADKQYNNLVRDILEFGEKKTSRGGAIPPTLDLFGPQLMFDMRDGFPLITTKKVPFKSIMKELCWMLRGESNINTLGVPALWEKWADEDGDLGPIYGKQWRKWVGVEKPLEGFDYSRTDSHTVICIDQIKQLLEQLKNSPDSRRLIVSTWNVTQIHKMGLPPCHMFFQCSVSGEDLDLKMYQRSADTAIGVPFNIAQYALLMHLLAKEVGLIPRRFIHTFGSAHIYEPHIEALKEQIERAPRGECGLSINPDKNFWQLIRDEDPADFVIDDYDPHPSVKYELF